MSNRLPKTTEFPCTCPTTDGYVRNRECPKHGTASLDAYPTEQQASVFDLILDEFPRVQSEVERN